MIPPIKSCPLNNIDTKSFVFQQDQSDCGVACLASIIKFHNGEYSLEQLRNLSGTSKQGTTLLGLMQAAQSLGFAAEGLEAESVANLKELTEPAILHVVIDNKLQHYLVFYDLIPCPWLGRPGPSPEEKGGVFDGIEHNNLLSFGNTSPLLRRGVGGEVFRLLNPAKGIIEMSAAELEKIWKSKALLKLTPTEKFERVTTTRSKKKDWIIGLIKDDFPLLAISLFLGILISLLGISTAIFSQKLIDDILPKENTEKLILSLVLVTLLLLARSGLGYLRGVFMIRQSQDFNNRIIKSFYGNLLSLPKSFFDTRKTGDLVARMNDTRRIQSVLSTVSGSIVIDLLVVIVSIVFVFAYSTWIGFILLSSLPVYFLILYTFNKPIVKAQKEVMGGYAMAESNFIDTMQGVADIKLSNTQNFFERTNSFVYGEFQKRMAGLGQLNIKFGLTSDIAGVVFMISIFGVASWLVISKELKLGEMVALLGMAGSVVPSVTRLVIANIQIQEALVAFDRMFEFTSIEKEETTKEKITDISFNALCVENLAFRFPGRKQILKRVSLSLLKGEITALLGESGHGKSTLLQLLQKFYMPEEGVIHIDDINLKAIETSAWRKQIGSMPQEPKIFNGNLLYNITLNDNEEDYKNAFSFCEEVGFGKYFNQLPQGYLTLIGEEGVNLSGGQKQLVVLARVLYRKPKLLLLDEATSAMDRNTENFILDLLQRGKKDRITLLVTHRIKTAQRCDRIMILENGSTVTSGTPNELLESKNFFSDSYLEMVSPEPTRSQN